MDCLRLNESLSPLVAFGFTSNFLFCVKEQILQENVPTHKDIITCTFLQSTSLFTLLKSGTQRNDDEHMDMYESHLLNTLTVIQLFSS